MGKIRGIFQFTGKVGEAVGMKGDDGLYYARVRVRDIANPNTKAQQDQRTVVSLAGKLSALTDRAIITGMKGSNARKRRAAFMANIINNANVTTVDGVNTAKLDPAKLILSEGAQTDLPTATITMSGSVISVVPSQWPENEDLAAVVYVAYGYDANNEYVDCQHRSVNAGTELAQIIVMGKTVVGANVYAIPVLRNPVAGSTKYNEALMALEANAEYAVTSGGTNGSALTYGQSSFLSEVTPA